MCGKWEGFWFHKGGGALQRGQRRDEKKKGKKPRNRERGERGASRSYRGRRGRKLGKVRVREKKKIRSKRGGRLFRFFGEGGGRERVEGVAYRGEK